jgi:cytochrome b subunit of formate dehydrogenase/mono/diheme cytochrome c family protein
MSEKQTFLRFSVARRIEHLVLILSFSILAVTGLVQKFTLSPISQTIIAWLGGIETTRIIHRTAATIFILEAIYHLVIIGFKLYVKQEQASMMPGTRDALDGVQALLYNLGFGTRYPRMGRYNFMEKMEYLAMMWGVILMALTGFVMWNPIATAKFLPGVIIPASKVAHGWEAVLAVLALIIWHFYNVHLRHWNWAMIKGTLTRHEMEEEHAEELEEVERGAQPAGLPEAIEEAQALQAEAQASYRRRLNAFIPTALILSVGFIYGFYRLETFEQTAITTLPQAAATVLVYVPVTATPTLAPTATPQLTLTQTPLPAGVATATPAAATALAWESGIGDLFKVKCAACHGSSGGLSVASYSDLMKGGQSGAVVVPGDPAGSPLVKLQSSGSHPGLFNPEELKQVEEWIQSGAPEK